MPLFSSRPQPSGVEAILQIINMGECDDHTIKQLQELLVEISDEDVRSLADVLMTNLVKYADDIAVLTGSVKALEVMSFMPRAKNEFIITLLVSLIKSPVNKRDALQHKALRTEIIKFLLFFVSEDDQYAKLMMPELIWALGETHGTISSNVFHTLQKLAVEKPDYFERYSASLIKQLGSINKSTRAEAAKIIGIIAKTHPEYVCKAMPFLQSLASFYPDAHVKRNANEAYQIIWRSTRKEPQAPAAAIKTSQSSQGFADIVKLNTNAPNGGSTDSQFTDDELKEIIDLTRKEFKSDAEAILNSLGVGHLTVKGKDSRSRSKVQQPKADMPQPKADMLPPKAEIHEYPEPAPVKAKKPILHDRPLFPDKQAGAEKPKAHDTGYSPMARSGIASAIKREPKESPLLKLPVKGHMPKCPRCGGSTWAEGQLCDTCAGAEFDRRAVKGNYDLE